MRKILIMPVPGYCDELAKRIAECARQMQTEVSKALEGHSADIVCIDDLSVTPAKVKRKAQWKREQNRYK